MSTDVNTQKILSSMDNITFVQEKSKYFREMRQRQDIQRNDFALEYAVTSASIEDNVAGLIYYFIPQQIKVRNAPDVKITATLIRPVPVGRSLTLGGTTDITCNSLNVTVQSPTGQTFTANSSGRSVGKSVTLTSAGLYTITVTAQKAASSTPVVYQQANIKASHQLLSLQ